MISSHCKLPTYSQLSIRELEGRVHDAPHYSQFALREQSTDTFKEVSMCYLKSNQSSVNTKEIKVRGLNR